MNTSRRSDQDLERLLADDGGELGALYRRLPRAEPPRRLDRSVLAEAARAVHGTRPRRQRWLVGFGSAAGLVLAAGVAWHVGHEALRQQEHQATRSAPNYVPVQPIEAPARRHESTPPADAAPASAPATEAPSAANASGAAKARAAKPAAEKAAPPPPAPAPMSPPPAPAAAPEPQPQPQPQSMLQQSAPAPAAAEAERHEALGAAESAADAAAPAKQAPEALQKRERATGTPALSSSAELRRDTQLAPELWLARIEQLLKQGRRQQAIESLQLFRRAHPDWRLPETLRELDR